MLKIRLLKSLLLFAVAALAGSCSAPKHEVEMRGAGPVWPAPPDEPRVTYLRSIRSPRDVGQKPSFFTRMGRWMTGDSGESLALQRPFGVAVDEAQNLCISDTGAKRICYCDFVRKQWRIYNGIGKVRFASPVAVAHKSGVFYVADSELAKVFAFRDDGKLIWEFGQPMQRPVGLAMLGNTLAIADSQAHAVFLLGLDGKLQSQFGQRGIGPGEFNFPTHIAADQRQHLLVTDSMNSRVQVFDLRGKFISEFGGNGDTSGHFGRPKGVATDTFGHVYVADALFDNLQIFDLTGRLLLNVGQSGAGPGQFGLPAGVAIGTNNQIYVADGYNHRVQVLKYVGQL
jgi:DNA-binding beta-propeller fold protein YncE